MYLRNVVGLLTIALFACSARAGSISDTDYLVPTGANEIKILSYNLQNLFDTEHDEGKDDFTFLPLAHPKKEAGCALVREPQYQKMCVETDWTPAKLELKLGQIVQAIQAQGALPDVMIGVEVENIDVAKKLGRLLGYNKVFITEGQDARGIDTVAFIREEKLAVLETKEIEVPGGRPIFRLHLRFKKAGKTRGDARELFVYGNHWPSQGAPTQRRSVIAEFLRKQIEIDQASVGHTQYFSVLVGDFNTRSDESPNPLDETLLNGNLLVDVEAKARRDGKIKQGLPKGSYYFQESPEDKPWKQFDHIIVTENLVDDEGTDVVLESFRYHAPTFMTAQRNGERVPKGYKFTAVTPASAGYSDHFAVLAKIKVQ